MNKKLIISIIVAAIIIPLSVYTISPLFIESTINEKLPDSIQTMNDEQQRVMTSHSGRFVGVDDGIHDAQGVVLVVPLEDGKNILRFEDFHSTNGPDLHVYLATDNTATDFVNLGRLKANNGDQNYEIPEGTDISKYDTALIWCKQFSVLFGHAELS